MAHSYRSSAYGHVTATYPYIIDDTSISGLLHALDEYKLASFSTSRGIIHVELVIETLSLIFLFWLIQEENPVLCIIWQMSDINHFRLTAEFKESNTI